MWFGVYQALKRPIALSVSRFRLAEVARINYDKKSLSSIDILVRNSSNTSIKIYTRTGDRGDTSLFNGQRTNKNGAFITALGNTDELSSYIGLAKEFALEKDIEFVDQLEKIQCILQDIGSLIATPIPQNLSDNPERKVRVLERLSFNISHIKELEVWIDNYSDMLPPLTNFILPGGGRISSALHVARTVCRRAERSIVPLVKDGCIDAQVLVYINRLSDYLFTVARVASLVCGKKEAIYIRPKPTENPST
ncbi:unnamed protein product [Meganyctiphanes norvegica]|uniref:Corrinoid adenosyltransferase MMAB n=1 Tax=Meganyctiphanes norvegica TaxID=48144 RepID=A0AAV2RTD8_MEGNR